MKFDSTEGFLSILDSQLQKKQTLWLIAHNAGFDAQISGLLDAIKAGRYRFVTRSTDVDEEDEESIWSAKSARFFLISDPPTILHLEDEDGRRFVLLDSMNWVRMALSKLGQLMQLPKGEMPGWDASDDEWYDYCERDVEILERWFEEFVGLIDKHELGSMKWTFSAQAMACYRSRFVPKGVESHPIEAVRLVERESYFGGEFRCFALGVWNQTVHQLDVNSLFPTVMRDRLYPARLDRWHWNEEWSTDLDEFDPSRAVAEVYLSTFEEEYLKRHDEGPIPAIGRFTTVLCGPELEQAFARGHVVGHRRWSTYVMADLFSDYVDTLYRLRMAYRQEGREDLQEFCKMLMNSLYGKFGQRGTELVYRPDAIAPNDWGGFVEVRPSTGESVEYMILAGDCYERVKRGELKASIPIISSWIASAARERMRQHRSLLDDGSLLYQAVDSLIVTDEGRLILEDKGLIDDHELGYYKHCASADRLEINGHGWYRIGDKVVLPGRNRTTAVDRGGGYEQLSFEGLRTTLGRGSDSSIWSTRRFVKFPGGFSRGMVGPDGVVSPLLLDEPRPF